MECSSLTLDSCEQIYRQPVGNYLEGAGKTLSEEKNIRVQHM